MATTTIDNTTVVFSNSTAAANLSASISESASSYVYNFDVLAYSGGGAKTTLWSVDDGVKGDDNAPVVVSSAFSGYNTDLLYKDAANTWETSSLGAKFAIVNGKIQYDASALNGQINHLGVGESMNDTIQYTIRMSNGTLSVGTLKVALTGTNDAVVLDHATGGATTDEDATTASTGTIAFTDADTNDNHTATFEAGAGNNNLGTFSLGTLTESHTAGSDAAGSVGWSYTVTSGAADYLQAGEHAEETFTVKVDDGHGGEAYQTVTIRIDGVNDLATITDSGAEDTDVTEAGNNVDGDASASGTLTVHDLDHDQATFAAVDSADLEGTYGSFTFNSTTGAWTYTLDDGAADKLAAGVTKTETLTVSSLDGTDSYTITVDVHGTNDAPVIGAADATYSIAENSTGLIFDFDASDVDSVDTADTLTWSLEGADAGAFSIDAAGKLSLTTQQDYETDNQLSLTVKVSDGHGGSATKDITVNITDVNEVVYVTNPTNHVAAPVGADPKDFDTLTGGVPQSGTLSGSGNTADTFTGDSSGQTINAGGGNDTVYGGGGNDSIRGQNDDDQLYGQPGNDSISGGNGNDVIYGGSGADNPLDGDAGNDTIYGGSGADTINGGAGNDLLVGGFGADNVSGGGDNDTFKFASLADSGDTITDFSAGDKIDVTGLGFTSFSTTESLAHGLWQVAAATGYDVYGDTDGDVSTYEFTFHVNTGLAAGDFIGI